MNKEQALASFKSFKEKLNNQHRWPAIYTFRFIVPADKAQQVRELLPGAEVTEKPSSKGTYKSLTARVQIQSGDEVIAIYIKAKKIEGIISL